ncbi:MAG: VCBS repeat-containing protein, partial [Bacteroidales bacterium]|nr:VCBS repeat-containing protein [Bacteroidales bacterium]
MKNINIFLLAALCSFILTGCKSSEEKEAQKAKDLVTTKTLGLAYLEEFELEKAEAEFLKFIDLAPKEKLGYANLGLTYLRMSKYPEAKKQLQKAIEIDPGDPDIRLILSTVYQMNDERDLAIAELEKTLTFAPDHVKVLYQLSDLYSTGSGDESQKQREKYILELVENAPENLVPRLSFTDILIRNGESDKALEQMEIISKLFPEFPREAVDYYDKTLSLLRKSDTENALIQFTVFHNYLKVTAPYQAGILDLKGPGGTLIGFPVITFNQLSSSRGFDDELMTDAVHYTDATQSAGLDIVHSSTGSESAENGVFTHVATSDYDGDGDIDIYAGSYDPATSSYKHYLFNNEMGRFREVSGDAGIRHSGRESNAVFADYDNDGFLDLFILKDGGDILYRNNGDGSFRDVTGSAKIGSRTGGNNALFFDLDHDGDLDMYEMTSDVNFQFRNNADGTFQDQSDKMGTAKKGVISRDAVFGDFDNDEDIDLIVVNENSGNVFYANQRLGVFKDVTVNSGLESQGGSSSITAGDYNNDGFIDLFITSSAGKGHELYRNLGDGRFEREKNVGELFRSAYLVRAYDASFLDINNDGFLDLLIAGEPSGKDGQGIFLYQNDGKGAFKEVTSLLPENIKSGRQLALMDYNDDGDIDIVVAGVNGGISLLRNDGGNNNHYIKMKLVGLRAGSAKNNYFGIGVKVEVRAGELYSTMVVTDPNIHIGIGSRLKADVIRITWTNGVPQNIFLPGSDQSLIESQVLKGSCPFLYTWNGSEYVFAKDILWRSALGMPLGIMGGTTAYAFADASDDYIKIPGEMLKAHKGKYTMQVTSELWETIYTDQLQLVAVDHPETTDVFVAEQFSPPPFPGFELYHVGEKKIPVSAKDSDGNDILRFIAELDDKYLAGFKPEKYQGITEVHDLILDPGTIDPAGDLFLFLYGWVFPTDASINFALSQSGSLKTLPPVIQVLNKKGEWVTVIDNLGFPMGKDKMVIADLSRKFLSSDHRIRIRTNMEIYWDHVFFSGRLSDMPVRSTVMNPVSADLHYRGFSKSYRKGGRYGPHWFDYSVVDKNPMWRDLSGHYTRYGDVLPLLMKPDNQYIISNAGDEVTVSFDANALPPLLKGWKRDFLIRSVGWVKDGDMNTAFGTTVLPLPFHGMTSYPPSEKDVYPNDPELEKYNKQY